MHLCLSSSVAQFPWFHWARWSAFGLPRIPSISRSASLCLLHISSFCPRHNCRRRSLFMRVLSHSDTRHLNGYIGWCGCHESSDQSRSSQGYMACCGCHEILTAICYNKEVFCRDQKMSEPKNFCYPDDRRITQRSQSNTTGRDKKMNS